MRVLVGCEESGVVRDAFLALGHDAMSCDLEPTRRPGPHYQGDIFDVIDYPWDLAIFHPPCTHTSNSGAKHFAAKRMNGNQQAAVSFFMNIERRSAHIQRTVFEQPMSIISTLFRKRDQEIHPHGFGHPQFKATWLWLRGLPPLEATNQLVVPAKDSEEWVRWNVVHRMPPGPDRARDRSATFQGIADAFALQYGGDLRPAILEAA